MCSFSRGMNILGSQFALYFQSDNEDATISLSQGDHVEATLNQNELRSQDNILPLRNSRLKARPARNCLIFFQS